MRADSYITQVLHHLAWPYPPHSLSAPPEKHSFLNSLHRELAGYTGPPTNESAAAWDGFESAAPAGGSPLHTVHPATLVELRHNEEGDLPPKWMVNPWPSLRLILGLMCAAATAAFVMVAPNLLDWIKSPNPSHEIPSVPASRIRMYQPKDVSLHPDGNRVRVSWSPPARGNSSTSYYAEARVEGDLTVSKLTKRNTISLPKLTQPPDSARNSVCFVVTAVHQDRQGALSRARSGKVCKDFKALKG